MWATVQSNYRNKGSHFASAPSASSGAAGTCSILSPFDGERCEPGIGNTGSSRFGLNAKSLEDVPVPLSRLYDLAMGLFKQVFAKFKGFLDRASDRPADCW
jgi:hypothetical protein